jgi:hypothetical protein
MSWKLDSSHAVSADGTQCDRCGVVAREFAATMPCLYEPIDPTSPAALPVSEEPRQSCYEKHGERCVYINPQTRRCEECGASAEEPRREEPDRLLRIAGLVNGYHNDGTKLSAADTLAAIADVLGDPFDFSSSAVVVGADQHALREALSAARDALAAFGKQAGWLPGQQAYSATMTDAEMKLAQAVVDIDQILAIPPALPDPGSPEREKERTERR